jgi:hypothetical protein
MTWLTLVALAFFAGLMAGAHRRHAADFDPWVENLREAAMCQAFASPRAPFPNHGRPALRVVGGQS